MSIIKKVTFYLFLGLTIILIVNLSKDIWRLSHAGNRLEQAKKELTEVKEKNEQLKRQKKQAEQGFYIEKQIRDKLGMAKQGEIVLILPDKLDVALEKDEQGQEKDLTNWQEWLRLFIEE